MKANTRGAEQKLKYTTKKEREQGGKEAVERGKKFQWNTSISVIQINYCNLRLFCSVHILYFVYTLRPHDFLIRVMRACLCIDESHSNSTAIGHYAQIKCVCYILFALFNLLLILSCFLSILFICGNKYCSHHRLT